MKSLLKGLRFIAHLFENEKEPEMQIGGPTDVKHVAHIGWEGPSSTAPSWMNEFKAPELMPENSESTKGGSNRKQKGRRKPSTGTSGSGSGSPMDSPRRVGGSTKQSKRSSGRHRDKSIGLGSAGSSSGSGVELSSSHEAEQSVSSRHSRQKKSKGSCDCGAKEKDTSVRGAACPFTGLGTSTGR